MVGKRRNEYASRIGKNIMESRKSLGLTQEQLAASLQVEPETISRFERGVTLPSLLTLFKLVDVLGTTMNRLLGEGEPRIFTETERLAALLEPLSDADREYVIESLKRLCAHLVERAQPRETD